MNPNETKIQSLDSLWAKLSQLPEPSDTVLTGNLEDLASDIQRVKDRIAVCGCAYLMRFLIEQVAAMAEVDLEVLKILVERKFQSQDHSGGLQVKHWAVPVIAQSLGSYLLDQGGPNSVQVGFAYPSTGRQFSLTLAWLDGEMPNERAKRLEEENQRLREELATLQANEEGQEDA